MTFPPVLKLQSGSKIEELEDRNGQSDASGEGGRRPCRAGHQGDRQGANGSNVWERDRYDWGIAIVD